MRKISCILLALMMTLSLSFSSLHLSFADSEKELVIVHTNDTHARVKSVQNKEGYLTGVGYDRISQYKKDLMKDNPNVLFLDAGDTLHGQPIATISRGESIVDIMNLMDIDAMAPGNHDFNYGYDRLKELEKKMNFPLIAANVVDQSGSLVFKPYITKKMDGFTVGIFGLATPETAYKTNPKNVANLEFQDPVKAAQKAVDALKKEKVDVIIGVMHLGLDEGDYTSDKVASGVEGIDVIIDGHSHTTLPQGRMVGKTLIASRGEYDKAFGVVTLKMDDHLVESKSAKLIMAKDAKELPVNEAIVNKINEITTAQKSILSQVIGKTEAELDGAREHVRTGETNLGQLVTDAMLEATKADLAITNGGGIRASIKIGDITKNDILSTFPFGNYLVAKKVSGKAILAALEHGVSKYPESHGGFPHVAGITFNFDASKKAGARISDVKIGDQPLEEEKSYTLVTNDFMAAGGDDYKMLKAAPIVNEYPALDEILIDYIQKKGALEGAFSARIHFLKEGSPAPSSEPVKPAKPEPPMPPAAEKELTSSIPEQTTTGIESEVPHPTFPALPAPPAVRYHIVAKGEMLWKIAIKYNTTWQILAELNKLKNPNLIYPNQKIMLPQ